MITLGGGVPLTVATYRRHGPSRRVILGYRGHDIQQGETVVATVFVYDDGRRTYEFDNEICYGSDLLREIVEAGERLTSGADAKAG